MITALVLRPFFLFCHWGGESFISFSLQSLLHCVRFFGWFFRPLFITHFRLFPLWLPSHESQVMVKLLVAPFAFQFSFQYCLHFSEIHSTLLVNFHLQRHMGNFVIQVGNLAKIMSVKIIWFSADTFFPRNLYRIPNSSMTKWWERSRLI